VKRKKIDWKTFLFYGFIGLLLISLLAPLFDLAPKPRELSFSQFLNDLDAGKISEVTVKGEVITGKTKEKLFFKTRAINYPNLIPELRSKNVSINVQDPAEGTWIWSLLLQIMFPLLFFGVIWWLLLRQASSANNQAMAFGKSVAKPLKGKTNVTFADVAGIDEAKEELREIVDFLKYPAKYHALGAKMPKGLLLMGAPGTGKTLLARAIAGEAEVPFFSISGSDFVEMFVGVGASRVRGVFKEARKQTPSIIFMDEIDAVGRHRGAGLGGGHDEREQTLNQLLVEMDGFDPKINIIVIAATNRPDILDPALLRPGRFDRQVVLDKPDIKGRKQILDIHSKGKPFSSDVDLEVVAKRTPGYTGADLENVLNEAAILTGRFNKKEVTMVEVEEAVDRVMAGPQRKSRVVSEKEKNIIAYHEVGHAVLSKILPDSDSVHKISVLPRGMALGYTLQLPTEEKHLISKGQILADISVLLGGRVAEEIFFGEITSGAQNDLLRATALAKKMVCEFGMSGLGPRTFGQKEHQIFLGRDIAEMKDYSDQTADGIDKEIEKIIEVCHVRARKLVKANKSKMEDIAKVLREKEVLEGESLKQALEGLTGEDA